MPRFYPFELEGRKLELMIETDGKFKGMVHVFDRDKHKINNSDVVVSGARWSWTSRDLVWDEDEDVYEEIEGLMPYIKDLLQRKEGVD